jgi:hypothetical protein
MVIALTATAACAAAAGLGLVGGCEAARDRRESATINLYPPAPQQPRVVALGTLRGGPAPTQAETDLTLFLFGAEPPPPLVVANPTALATTDAALLICDNRLDTILRWDLAAFQISERAVRPGLLRPHALNVMPTGDWLICDQAGARRVTPRGEPIARYELPDGAFRAGGILAVDDAVWVSNLAAHRVDVFDAETGEHRFVVGEPGRGPGQFAMPRSLARLPDGAVCISDMLNNRVQVFAPTGEWLRDIGQPGTSVGTFGRAKDVAVGPDGTVFVTDAFSQRVHAFLPDGTPLLAFGEPGSGAGALSMPSGIAIAAESPIPDPELPQDTTPQYYVLVSEQLDRPGVRVYAWLGAAPPTGEAPLLMGEPEWQPPSPELAALNPHWRKDRCNVCHEVRGEQVLPIAPARVDALCLSCHDGVRAPADPHPIGRPANTELVTTPPEWPTFNGEIGCMTCHDFERQHCSRAAERPLTGTQLLRFWDPQRPLDYCTHCHRGDVGGRFSPHRQRDAAGRVRDDACLFCHTQRPEIPADGERQFEPHLRVASSALCLNCHTKHWDLSPLGHVDRPVPEYIREWMILRELARETNAPPNVLAELASQPDRQPALLPLGDGMVTCYTCHNPHYAGLFPEDSELGALADHPLDRASALRTDWVDLCSECHHH